MTSFIELSEPKDRLDHEAEQPSEDDQVTQAEQNAPAPATQDIDPVLAMIEDDPLLSALISPERGVERGCGDENG